MCGLNKSIFNICLESATLTFLSSKSPVFNISIIQNKSRISALKKGGRPLYLLRYTENNCFDSLLRVLNELSVSWGELKIKVSGTWADFSLSDKNLSFSLFLNPVIPSGVNAIISKEPFNLFSRNFFMWSLNSLSLKPRIVSMYFPTTSSNPTLFWKSSFSCFLSYARKSAILYGDRSVKRKRAT